MKINSDDLDEKGIEPKIKKVNWIILQPSKSYSDEDEDMAIHGNDNDEEVDEIKALVDPGADLIEIEDTLADENYALDKVLNLFVPIYNSCKGL